MPHRLANMDIEAVRQIYSLNYEFYEFNYQKGKGNKKETTPEETDEKGENKKM